MVLDIHETMVIPPIVFLPSMTIGGQTYTIPLDTPRPRPPPFRLPLLFVNALGDNWIVGASNSTGMSGGFVTAPTQGILIHTGPSSATTGSLALTLPTVTIPTITTSPIPLKIDVSGGLPAFTLFPVASTSRKMRSR